MKRIKKKRKRRENQKRKGARIEGEQKDRRTRMEARLVSVTLTILLVTAAPWLPLAASQVNKHSHGLVILSSNVY